MNRLVWTARQWGARLGWRGVAGFGLLVVGLGVYLLGVMPAQDRLDAAADRLSGMRQQVRGAAGLGQLLTTAEKLQAFHQFFPQPASAPQWVDKVFGAAGRNSLTLEQGEYRMLQERDSRIGRYQLTFPVKGSYPQIRGFLEDVLRDVPAMALDNVTFKRETIAATVVEAQVRFSLFLGMPQ